MTWVTAPISYAVVSPLTAMCLTLGQSQVCSDGVLDTLPQKMASWHIEYFKLKEFEKLQMQAGVSDLPSPPEAGVKTLMWQVPSPYLDEGSVLISKMEGHLEKPEQAGVAKFPSADYAYLILSPVISFHSAALCINPSINALRFNHFIRSSFLYEGSRIAWNLY